MSKLIAGVFWLTLATSSWAVDSSGGARIAQLIKAVSLQKSSYNYDTTLFEWTDSGQQRALQTLASILTQMPLDVADLPQLKLSISSSRCAILDPKDMGPVFFGNVLLACTADGGHYSVETLTVWISGALYPYNAEASNDEKQRFAGVILHEFTHAWEARDRSESNADKPPARTRSFYAIRYNKLNKIWREALKKNSAMTESLKKTASALYEELKLPSSCGGSTGRRCLNSEDQSISMHPMASFEEYLATLSELLWVSPDLAAKGYSKEEIDWVKNHVFKNRAIIPYNANPPPSSINEIHNVKAQIQEKVESVLLPSLEGLGSRRR